VSIKEMDINETSFMPSLNVSLFMRKLISVPCNLI